MSVRTGRTLLALGCALLVAWAGWWPAPATAAEPARLVLVLDSSGSMKTEVRGETKISIAKASLRTVVGRLPADAPVGLRVYGATVFDRDDKGACTDSQLVVPIGTGNRSRLTAEIDRYKPYGETPISYSLQQAARDLGGEGKRTILLVSDGEETCDADPCATAAAIAESGVDVKIDVVGLAVGGRTRDQLQCVARRGNGTYYDANSRADLEASLDKLATRAFRPFRLTGTPVRGSTTRSKAPVVGPGQYVDSIPGSEKPLYYRIPRTSPGSTLRVGFTARPVGQVPGASLRLRDAAGNQCDWDVALAIAISGSEPLVTGELASWRRSEDDPCNTEDELVAEVTAANSDLLGAPFELLVSEEPPLVDDRDLPPAETALTWQSMPTRKAVRPPVPGSSLSDAPLLEPGTYQTSILTGETQVFAVPTDWGQRVQVEVRVAPRRSALARALSVTDSLDLQLLGAGRGRYVNLNVARQPQRSFGMSDDAEPYRVTEASPTISYLNRGQPGTVASGAIPGPQYVVLNMNRQRDVDPFLVPYTLVVHVIGTAGEGRPDYAAAATPSPTPTPTPTPAPPSAGTPAPATAPPTPPAAGGVSLGALTGVGVGALALGAGGAAAVVWLRRRASSTR